MNLELRQFPDLFSAKTNFTLIGDMLGRKKIIRFNEQTFGFSAEGLPSTMIVINNGDLGYVSVPNGGAAIGERNKDLYPSEISVSILGKEQMLMMIRLSGEGIKSCIIYNPEMVRATCSRIDVK